LRVALTHLLDVFHHLCLVASDNLVDEVPKQVRVPGQRATVYHGTDAPEHEKNDVQSRGIIEQTGDAFF
jgi:hypothetical protein